MHCLLRFLAVGFWLSLVNALDAHLSKPIPPSQDPWYTAPDGFEKAAPGTVLRLRPAPDGLLTIVGNASAAYHALFRTTDASGNPSWAVTTLFVPQYTEYKGFAPKSLVSYQLAYDTPSIDWSPSYSMYLGQSTIPIEVGFVNDLLWHGWYVAVPDYEGPLGSLSVGYQGAHAVLDTLRATTSMTDIIGADAPDLKFGIWGYSGGGEATAWAAELKEQYAPELNITAVATGGLSPDVIKMAKRLDTSWLAGMIVSVTVGLVAQFPEANKTLADALNPTGIFSRDYFYSCRTRDLVGNYAAYAYHEIANYFTDHRVPWEIPVIKDIIQNQTTLGNHGVPKMPYFLYTSKADDGAPVEDSDSLMAKYCANGANILYRRSAANEHIAEDVKSESQVIEWFSHAFGGIFNQTGCKIEDIS